MPRGDRAGATHPWPSRLQVMVFVAAFACHPHANRAQQTVAGQDDASRIADLESELAELRETGRAGIITCAAAGGFVSIAPILDVAQAVTGYEISNVTAAEGAGLTVLEVALSDQYTDIMLPGMIVRVFRADAESAGDNEPMGESSIPGLDELTGGMDIWSVIGGNLLTWLFGCIFFAIVVALEKKYQCIGGEKIHEMVEQHHYLQQELVHVIHTIKGVPEDMGDDEDKGGFGGMTVEGAQDLGGAGNVAAQAYMYGMKKGGKGGKAGFVSALASERHQLEGMMTPEEIQMKHRADIYDKVSHDERAITAVAVGKTQGHKAAEKAKHELEERGGAEAVLASGGDLAKKGGGFVKKTVAEHQPGGAPAAKPAAGGGRMSFIRKGGGSPKPEGLSAKAGGCYKQKKTGSGDGSKKVQNPMMRMSMQNPINIKSPLASSDKSQSLLGSELSVADDGGED